MDAGDLLEVLITRGVNVVLSGHKHVPYVWRLENMYVANAGTVSSLRAARVHEAVLQRAGVRGDEVKIRRRFPFGGDQRDRPLLALHRRAVPPGARTARAGARRPVGERAPDTASEEVAHHARRSSSSTASTTRRSRAGRSRSRATRGTTWSRRCSSAAWRSSARGADPSSACRVPVAGAGPDGAALGGRDRRADAPEGVLDLSDEPVLGYRERMELAAVALVAGRPLRRHRTSGSTRRSQGAAAVRADARRHRHRQAHRQDRDRRRGRPASPRRWASTRSSSRWAAAGRPSPQVAEAGSVDLERLLELVRAGRARRLRLPRGRAHDRRHDDRRPPGRRRPRRRAVAPATSREAAELAADRGPGLRDPRGQRRRACPRCPGTPASWWCRRRCPPSTSAATWARTACCDRTWWCLQWLASPDPGPENLSAPALPSPAIPR